MLVKTCQVLQKEGLAKRRDLSDEIYDMNDMKG